MRIFLKFINKMYNSGWSIWKWIVIISEFYLQSGWEQDRLDLIGTYGLVYITLMLYFFKK